MSNVVYAVESIDKVMEEITPLMVDHDKVITNDLTQGFPLDVNVECYKTLERMGLCVVFTARAEKKLIGYCTIMFNTSIQRRSCRLALEDAFYVHPDWRKNGVASDMVDFIESMLVGTVDILHFHAPESNPVFEHFLKRKKGYKKYASILSKILKE